MAVVPSLLLAAGSDYLNGSNGTPAPMSRIIQLLVFIGIPLAFTAFVALLVLRPRAVGAVSYRPGRPWGFGVEWFGTRPQTDAPRVAVPGAGGASARW
jgi:hypothetical protein